MKEQGLSLGISIVLVTIGAAFSHWYRDIVTLRDSIYVGIFSYLVSISYFTSRRLVLLDKLPEVGAVVDRVVEALEAEGRLIAGRTRAFDVFWHICLLRSKAGIYKAINATTFELAKEQFPRFWQQAILNTDLTWYCTNFVNAPDDWKAEWSRAGFQFQSVVSKMTDAPVRRLFIARHIEELNDDLVGRMRWHESLGFAVRCICLDRPAKWATFGNLKELIGTLDIAIVNDAYLIAFILTGEEERGISFVRCYADPSLVGRVNDIYQHCWDAAHKLDALDTVLRDGQQNPSEHTA
jgi:hypothetical protein